MSSATHARRRFRILPADRELGWTPYAWLVYLPIFLVDPALRAWHGALAPGPGAAALLATALFLATYFRAFWTSGWELLLIAAVQTALGIGFAAHNPGAAVFFVYAASFAGNFDRERVAAAGVVLIAAIGAGATLLTHAPLYYLIPAGVLPLLIGFVNLHGAQVSRTNAKLRLAQEQVERLAAVAERERIARDLHDLLGHTLSLIVLKAELARKLVPRAPERAAQEIGDVEQVARRALQEVREAIRGYRRASVAGEVAQSREILRAAAIRADIEVPPATLESAVEEALALALREAVTNLVRHSGASSCRVWLRCDAAACVLEVEDDGQPGSGAEGSGLRGMRERVEALGGSVERGAGTAGRGTRVRVQVPLGRAPACVEPGEVLREELAAAGGRGDP